MRRKPLNPNSMGVIMENFKRFVNDLAEEEGADNLIYLFEDSQVTTCDFDVLLEQFDNKEITLEYLYSTWEKSFLHEAQILAEANILDWGKEKIAQLSDQAKKAWAQKAAQIIQRGKILVIKGLNQAIAFFGRLLQTVKGLIRKGKEGYASLGVQGYMKGMALCRQLIQTMKTAARWAGPFVFVVAACLVLMIAFTGTAHAYAAGAPIDPELWSVATEICYEAFTIMNGLEQLEPDTMEQFYSITRQDGVEIQAIDQFAFDQSMSQANQMVDTLKTLTDGVHQKITVDGERLNLLQIYEYADPTVQAEIDELLQLAAQLREDDPELFKEYVKSAKTLDVFWDGHLRTVLEDSAWIRTQSVGDESSMDSANLFRSHSQSAGVDYPSRIGQATKRGQTGVGAAKSAAAMAKFDALRQNPNLFKEDKLS